MRRVLRNLTGCDGLLTGWKCENRLIYSEWFDGLTGWTSYSCKSSKHVISLKGKPENVFNPSYPSQLVRLAAFQ
jgi:hypothetical protein